MYVNYNKWYEGKYHLQTNVYTKPNLTWGCQGKPFQTIDFEVETCRTTEDDKTVVGRGGGSVSAE